MNWRWLLAILVLASLAGCQEPTASLSLAVPAAATRSPDIQRTADGRVVLGSPGLTSGIPGEGPLTLAEIERWLADPRHHEPLDWVLPEHLAASESQAYVPEDNPFTLARIELGRQLFFDARLSASGAMSCADCHHPKKAYTNFIGAFGKLRDPPPTFNRLLSRQQFWDGKAASLEEQVRFPIENPLEMHSTQDEVLAKVTAMPGYRQQLEHCYGEVSFAAICRAIACFERALVTGPAEWDNAQAGRGELPEAVQRGAALFYSERTNCSVCHCGPNFTDEAFHNVGAGLDREPHDLGRYNVTKEDRDRGAFKTPTLRNVALTAPYMHDGRFHSLEEVVAWFTAGGYSNPHQSSLVKPLNLSRQEQADLVAFLKSLTGPFPPVETGRLPE